MHQEVKANILLELDDQINFFLDEIVVFLLSDLAFGELRTSCTNLFGLLSNIHLVGYKFKKNKE